jgi:hypothetical protein
MTRQLTATATFLVAALLASGTARLAADGRTANEQSPASQSDHASHAGHAGHAENAMHEHGAPVPAVSFADLQRTTEQLTAARAATEKYRDVHVAEAAGYRAIGPDVPGMGLHYVRAGDHDFSIANPPILLYEKDATMPSGMRLVGVSYLFVAPGDADGQPANPPFPKALASWHKHNNVCVLPDNSASVDLTEAQCTGRGGRFTAETSWMVHAWIWKDSPTGVFASTNPLVK